MHYADAGSARSGKTEEGGGVLQWEGLLPAVGCLLLHPASCIRLHPGCPFFTHTNFSKHFLFSAIKNCPPPLPCAHTCPTTACSCVVVAAVAAIAAALVVGRMWVAILVVSSLLLSLLQSLLQSLSLSLLASASHNRQLHTQPLAAPRFN